MYCCYSDVLLLQCCIIATVFIFLLYLYIVVTAIHCFYSFVLLLQCCIVVKELFVVTVLYCCYRVVLLLPRCIE